ncbi:hypothetical protein Pla8534_46710 [Lignipirellula cremea]|uniref:Uncharacterized protein n=1 Tax=Lignipirellula cremea TaxID=2528010 RepID=A0A518DYC4_9BACT|nr:hypothetical protein Pla8534_46710 [Lignipirellula cremea]
MQSNHHPFGFFEQGGGEFRQNDFSQCFPLRTYPCKADRLKSLLQAFERSDRFFGGRESPQLVYQRFGFA